MRVEGRWIQDREFGLQFKAELLNNTAPTTKEGIEKYLGSGMVKESAQFKSKSWSLSSGRRFSRLSSRNLVALSMLRYRGQSGGKNQRRLG